MPAADGARVVALDFDATMVERGAPMRWRPRAKEFVLGCAAAGVRIWLFSCRCAPACHLANAEGPGGWEAEDFWETGRAPEAAELAWRLFEEMRAFLEAEGVWSLMTPWTLPGKPLVDAIIDDESEQPNFTRLAAELGIHLAPAYPSPGVSSVHAEPSRPAADVQVGAAAAPVPSADAASATAAAGPPGAT